MEFRQWQGYGSFGDMVWSKLTHFIGTVTTSSVMITIKMNNTVYYEWVNMLDPWRLSITMLTSVIVHSHLFFLYFRMGRLLLLSMSRGLRRKFFHIILNITILPVSSVNSIYVSDCWRSNWQWTQWPSNSELDHFHPIL